MHTDSEECLCSFSEVSHDQYWSRKLAYLNGEEWGWVLGEGNCSGLKGRVDIWRTCPSLIHSTSECKFSELFFLHHIRGAGLAHAVVSLS